jgi:hypothetical protein
VPAVALYVLFLLLRVNLQLWGCHFQDVHEIQEHLLLFYI